MKIRLQLGLLAAVAIATPLLAQPRGTGGPGSYRSEVRLQTYNFGNFFYTPVRGQEEDVLAFGTEYRGAYRMKKRPFEVYTHASFLHYDHESLEDSLGGRLGLRYSGRINSFRTYVDRTVNRPSFEVGNVFAPADTTTFALDHSVRVSRAWEIGAEGRHQVQSFESPQRLISTFRRNNTFSTIGGSVRYRGFGYRYTPSIGFRHGNLSVRNPEESYGDRNWYVQMETIPFNGLYFSLRYGDRSRDYTISNPTSSNFGRREGRGQIEFVTDYKPQGRFGYTLYYAREDIDSQRVNGDFTIQLLLLGVSVGF